MNGFSAFGSSTKWRALVLGFVLALLGLSLFRETLYTLGVKVIGRHDSSHAVFVPFISAYLLWLQADRLKKTRLTYAPLSGILVMSVGILLAYVADASFSLRAVSFFIVLSGGVLAVAGTAFFKQISFPLLFLIAMVPLPEAWYTQIAEWMRQAITWGSVSFLHSVGFPIFRDGFNIHLPEIDLHVGHACSGIRHFLSFFVFAMAYAFRFKESLPARVLVVISTIPLSVFSGTLRLTIIFSLAHYVDPFLAEHRPHVIQSWIVFMLVLVGAVTVDRFVSRKRAPILHQTVHQG
jgi:exosortase